MSPSSIPPQEVHIDLPLVEALIQEQAPEFGQLTIKEGNSGWDNCLFRLGEKWQIRLPRRAQALQNQEVEIRWLTKLDHLPVAIPKPIFIGKPSKEFPWPWTIVPWFKGNTANQAKWMNPTKDLLPFFQALHGSKMDDVPHNPFRSCTLKEKEESLLPRMKRLREKGILLAHHDGIWQEALAAPAETKVPIHGDLHPANILVHEGKLAAILDWGDFCLGERAVDLTSLWLIPISCGQRQECFEKLDASQATISKSKGWALFYGVLFSDIGLGGDQGLLKLGKEILCNLKP